MVEVIQTDFDTILPIWLNKLWPVRDSKIESHSAMLYKSNNYDLMNFLLPAWYYAICENNSIIGVNSGHLCTDGSIRSRGLWIDSRYRNNGYGKLLLCKIVDIAIQYRSTFIWSFPRKTAWNTYKSVGFMQTSDWIDTETSNANAYCRIILRLPEDNYII